MESLVYKGGGGGGGGGEVAHNCLSNVSSWSVYIYVYVLFILNVAGTAFRNFCIMILIAFKVHSNSTES